MPRKRSLPYLNKIGQRGRISIWLVDGSFIRTNIDEEFSNCGQHGRFKYIPNNEFWLDQEASPDEQEFYIHYLTVEHRMMQKGMPYEQAREIADKVQREDRERAGDVQKMTHGGRLPDPNQVHLRLWKKLESSVSVWIVDGRLVRSVFDVDFTEGGHDYVYEYIPDGEVWIDNDLQDAERPYALLHELHERHLMAQGWDYDRAHEDSSRLERRYRKHPNQLHDALAEEGWE